MKTQKIRWFATLTVLASILCPADKRWAPHQQNPVFIFPALYSTNSLYPLEFEFRITDETGHRKKIGDRPAASTLPLDEAIPATKEDQIDPETWNSAAVLENIAEYGILCWQLGLTPTNQPAVKGAAKRAPAQVFEIEHLFPTRPVRPEEERFSKLQFLTTKPQPAWHEWFSTGNFIASWVKLWSTEHSEDFVVLLSISF